MEREVSHIRRDIPEENYVWQFGVEFPEHGLNSYKILGEVLGSRGLRGMHGDETAEFLFNAYAKNGNEMDPHKAGHVRGVLNRGGIAVFARILSLRGGRVYVAQDSQTYGNNLKIEELERRLRRPLVYGNVRFERSIGEVSSFDGEFKTGEIEARELEDHPLVSAVFGIGAERLARIAGGGEQHFRSKPIIRARTNVEQTVETIPMIYNEFDSGSKNDRLVLDFTKERKDLVRSFGIVLE